MHTASRFGLTGLSFALVLGATMPVVAEIPGAVQVIRDVQALSGDETADGPKDALSSDIEAMTAARTNQPAEAQANAWVELLLKYEKTMKTEQFQQLVSALPGPDAWPALDKAIGELPAAEGKTVVLRRAIVAMLPALLLNDSEKQGAALESIRAKFGELNQPGFRYGHGEHMQALETFVGGVEDVNREPLALKQFQAQFDGRFGNTEADLPDLLKHTDEASVKVLLMSLLDRRMLIEPTGRHETAKLAAEMALERVDTLPIAQWNLTLVADDLALYEALSARFDKPVEDKPKPGATGGLIGGIVRMMSTEPSMERNWALERARVQADQYYVEQLLKLGREEDAYNAMKAMIQRARAGEEGVRDLRYFGGDRALDRVVSERRFMVFDRLLSEAPTLPLWETYVRDGTLSRKDDAMLARIDAAIKSDLVGVEAKSNLRTIHIGALLATSKVDEAIVEMRALLDDDNTDLDDRLGVANRLVRIGLARKNDAWIDEGVKASTDILAEQASMRDGSFRSWQQTELIGLLVQAGRMESAFAMRVDTIRQAQLQMQAQEVHFRNESELSEGLTGLAHLYHQLGRHKDVLVLLKDAPSWGAEDLAQVEMRSYRGVIPVHYMAAVALAEEGRVDEAVKVLHALIAKLDGYDPAYELLLKLEGDEAEPFLRSAFERDQFQERPLIWLGVLKLRQGKLDEAQQVLQQAISIDPSDGEQGKGDRMRVYAVLADVMAAKGDKEQEKFLREVVRAIRMSEDADDLHEAGLLREAIDLYLESVGVFADAYCIQSRLAIQLMEMGMFEQAKEHYRRAYELMPDSFGRMESHCFGCEGAFSGELATSIAEDVFVKLSRTRANDSKVHYLLGYLRSSQDRDEEAVKSYLRAVELDPDYINAWRKLSGYASDGLLTNEQNDHVALNLIRLDPLGNHGYPNIQGVHDLAAVWQALEKGIAMRPEPVTTLLPLTASAEHIKRQPANPYRSRFTYGFNSTFDSAAAFIAQRSIVKELVSLHQMVEYAGMRY